MPKSRTPDGRLLERFLAGCKASTLRRALGEPWLNAILPEMDQLIGCQQGDDLHLEGDVATHTVMVCATLPLYARRYLDREPDFIERLAALIHDWKKPTARRHARRDSVPFPHHEQLAAAETPLLARRLGLTPREEARLRFIVANHGLAHEYPFLPEARREQLARSRFWPSLALLQAADAHSCWCPGGGHLPVHWELFEQAALPFDNAWPISHDHWPATAYQMENTIYAELHSL